VEHKLRWLPNSKLTHLPSYTRKERQDTRMNTIGSKQKKRARWRKQVNVGLLHLPYQSRGGKTRTDATKIKQKILLRLALG